jgi:hypothetical protein
MKAGADPLAVVGDTIVAIILKTSVHHRGTENTEKNHRVGKKAPTPIG